MEQQKRILLIEDEADLRDALQAALIDAGFITVTSDTTEAGLKQIMEHTPDLVVLDIFTKSMHGALFLDRVRALEAEQGAVKVLVLTNLEHEATQAKLEALGIEDYLVKTHVSLDAIVARIKACLQ